MCPPSSWSVIGARGELGLVLFAFTQDSARMPHQDRVIFALALAIAAALVVLRVIAGGPWLIIGALMLTATTIFLQIRAARRQEAQRRADSDVRLRQARGEGGTASGA